MNIQEQIVKYSSKLKGLTPGRTGNFSVINDGKIAITPTGVDYDDFKARDVPVIDKEGNQISGKMKPSSEVPMHVNIYDKFDCKCIVHVHSTWATTLSVLGEELPPIHYMIEKVGDVVPVADYATYGSQKLSENVAKTMKKYDTKACFIANHGMVVIGDDIEETFENTMHLENLAKIYCNAKSIGKPNILSGSELSEVREKFDTYGQ